MRRILFIIALLTVAVGCAWAQSLDSPHIEFAEKVHDFGVIHEKDGQVSAQFEFTNTGSRPLVITSAYASCGCTKPQYPEDPILPGHKAKITVYYNPYNRVGEFVSTVTINTNDKGNKKVKLKLTGTVVP